MTTAIWDWLVFPGAVVVFLLTFGSYSAPERKMAPERAILAWVAVGGLVAVGAKAAFFISAGDRRIFDTMTGVGLAVQLVPFLLSVWFGRPRKVVKPDDD